MAGALCMTRTSSSGERFARLRGCMSTRWDNLATPRHANSPEMFWFKMMPTRNRNEPFSVDASGSLLPGIQSEIDAPLCAYIGDETFSDDMTVLHYFIVNEHDLAGNGSALVRVCDVAKDLSFR